MLDLFSLSRVYDANGKMTAVIIPADIWAEIEEAISEKHLLKSQQQEDISGFNELMQAWNFRYPYDPAVNCPQCGRGTKDWRKKDDGYFFLVSASFGGLLVFKCQNCGTTIRHKYFKDHMTVESSPANSAQA